MELTNREYSIWKIQSAHKEKIASPCGEGWRKLYERLRWVLENGHDFPEWGRGGGEGAGDQTPAEHQCSAGSRQQGWARGAGGTGHSTAEELRR